MVIKHISNYNSTQVDNAIKLEYNTMIWLHAYCYVTSLNINILEVGARTFVIYGVHQCHLGHSVLVGYILCVCV